MYVDIKFNIIKRTIYMCIKDLTQAIMSGFSFLRLTAEFDESLIVQNLDKALSTDNFFRQCRDDLFTKLSY